MSEHCYRIVDKLHQRLHQYMEDLYDVTDGQVATTSWQHVRTESTASNHSVATYRHSIHPNLEMERAHFPIDSKQFYERLSSFSSRSQWDNTCVRCHEVEVSFCLLFLLSFHLLSSSSFF